MVEPEVRRLLAGDRPVLVLDLAEVAACDSAGLAMLNVCGRAAGAAGVELRLAAPQSPILHALHTQGLTSRLRVFSSVDGATRADPLELL